MRHFVGHYGRFRMGRRGWWECDRCTGGGRRVPAGWNTSRAAFVILKYTDREQKNEENSMKSDLR